MSHRSAALHPGRRQGTGERALSRPPAVVIGGRENAISVARSLGRRGIRVYALNHSRALVRFSRYCKRLKAAGEKQANWLAYLLSPWTVKVRGAFLIACSDDGLQLLIENREALLQKGYRLDLCDTNAQATVLDKLRTVEAAARAGVPAPKHWVVESIADVERIRDELSFPLILKPLHAHVFTARFAGRKYLKARSYQEVHGTIAKMEAAKVPFMLQELIEGPDTLLCSYYTYLDEDLEPQFDFTKAIVRRFPVNEGGATYHVVTRDPEVQEIARRFVKGVGLRGLSVTEFKRDRRDGKLKLIECNGRLSAANNVVMEAGFDLPIWLYNRAVGIPQDPLPSDYRTNLHLWYPVRDFKAFRQLRARGEMTFKGWMRSIRPKGVKKITPFWSWRDPLPSLVEASRVTRGLLRKVLAMPFRRWPRPTPRPAAPVGETRERTPS